MLRGDARVPRLELDDNGVVDLEVGDAHGNRVAVDLLVKRALPAQRDALVVEVVGHALFVRALRLRVPERVERVAPGLDTRAPERVGVVLAVAHGRGCGREKPAAHLCAERT